MKKQPEPSQSSRWTEQQKNEFDSSCVAQGKGQLEEEKLKRYCACMLVSMQERYPELQDAAKVSMQELSTMATDCLHANEGH